MQILHSLGIPTPKTVVVENRDTLKEAIQSVGGVPVILKDPFGTFGSGCGDCRKFTCCQIGFLVPCEGSLWFKNTLPSQKEETPVFFVVGDRVIAAMERSAQAEEFRSNVELGGKAEAVQISDEYARIALEATRAVGLDYAGVDIIESKNGPVVLEVNGNPGFKALEAASGTNVAAAILELAYTTTLRTLSERRVTSSYEMVPDASAKFTTSP